MSNLVDEEYSLFYLSTGSFTGKYAGIRQIDSSGASVSAYLKPVEKDDGALAVWVNPEKLDEVLNFIRTIGAYICD